MSNLRRLPMLCPALTALLLSAAPAAAHCCHDDGAAPLIEENQFRRGLHDAGSGITDGSIQADPPSIGRGFGQRGMGNSFGGGLGEMRGSSLGAYGAGSVGERAPGGLGSQRGNWIGVPPPRPR